VPGVNVIMVGPLVRKPNVFVDVPEVYCVVASCDDGGYFNVIAGAEDADDAVRLRRAIVAGLEAHRPTVSVLPYDDELTMARQCEALWPSARTT
jgi:hypothetical protein